MRFSACIFVLATSMLPLAQSGESRSFAAETYDRDRFLAEYDSGVRPLIEFYSRIQMTATVVRTGFSSQVPVEKCEVSLLGNGISRRLNVNWISSVNKSNDGCSLVFVDGPISFEAIKYPGVNEYILGKYRTHEAAKYDNVYPGTLFARAPFEYRLCQLTDLFKMPQCKIISVEQIDPIDAAEQDEHAVQVDLDIEWPSSDREFIRCVFLSSQHWALRKVSSGYRESPRKIVFLRNIEMRYHLKEDGFPELTEVRESLAAPTQTASGVTTIDRFSAASAAEHVFTPQSLAISFPATTAAAEWFPFATLGIAALIIALMDSKISLILRRCTRIIAICTPLVRLVSLALSILLLLASCYSFHTRDKPLLSTRPVIQVASPIKAGAFFLTDVVVQNSSLATRQILGVAGSFRPPVPPIAIAPLSSTTLSLQLGVNESGDFEIPVVLYTDSSIQPEIAIKVVGSAISNGLEVHPKWDDRKLLESAAK